MDIFFILSLITFLLSNTLTVVLFFGFLENRKFFDVSVKKFADEELPPISIVVPVYNEGKNILRVLESIEKSDYPKDKMEVIIVDDCSQDDTYEIVKGFIAKKPYYKLKRREINGGAASAKNDGIKSATNEIIVTLDSDTVLSKESLRLLVSEMLENDYDAMAGAVKVYKPKNLIERLQYLEYNLILFFRRILQTMESVSVTPGALSIYRKSALLKVGLFDEKSITEDQEIAFKLQKEGYKVGSSLKAVAFTIPPANIISLFKQRLRWVVGGFYNRWKHRDLANFVKYGDFSIFGFFFDLFFAFPFLLFVFALYLTFTDPSRWFERVGLDAVYMSIDALSFVLSFSAFLVAMFSVYEILYAEEKTKLRYKVKWYDYALFALFYGMIWFFIWPVAIYKFLVKNYEWGTR